MKNQFLFLLLLCGGLAIGQSATDRASARAELVRAGAEYRVEAGNFTAFRIPKALSFPTPDPESTALAFLSTYGLALGLTTND